MEPVDGFNAAAGLPEPHRSDPRCSGRWASRSSTAPRRSAPSTTCEVGLGDFGRPDGYLERQVGRWRSQLDELPRDQRPSGSPTSRASTTSGDWLDANRPESSAPGIIHGDYHTANVMYRHDGPQLAAIVDWELTTIGDPLIDLGLIIAFRTPDDEASMGPGGDLVEAFPSVDELVARYARAIRPRRFGGRLVRRPGLLQDRHHPGGHSRPRHRRQGPEGDRRHRSMRSRSACSARPSTHPSVMRDTMKALVFNGPRDIRYEDYDDPELTVDNGVIFKVEKCSICGSDLHIYHGDAIGKVEYGKEHRAVLRRTRVHRRSRRSRAAGPQLEGRRPSLRRRRSWLR